MLAFIFFIFKLLFAIILGFLIGANYNQSTEKSDEKDAILTSIYSFISVSLISIVNDFSNGNIIAISLIIISLIYFLESATREDNNKLRLKLFFALITGITLGLGYVLSSIIIVTIFTYSVNNSNVISNLLKRKIDTKNIKDDNKIVVDEEFSEFEVEDYE